MDDLLDTIFGYGGLSHRTKYMLINSKCREICHSQQYINSLSHWNVMTLFYHGIDNHRLEQIGKPESISTIRKPESISTIRKCLKSPYCQFGRYEENGTVEFVEICCGVRDKNDGVMIFEFEVYQDGRFDHYSGKETTSVSIMMLLLSNDKIKYAIANCEKIELDKIAYAEKCVRDILFNKTLI